MEAVRTSDTLVNSYQSTWCYNPEDCHIHIHDHKNLKSYIQNPFKMYNYLKIKITNACHAKCSFSSHIQPVNKMTAFFSAQRKTHQPFRQRRTYFNFLHYNTWHSYSKTVKYSVTLTFVHHTQQFVSCVWKYHTIILMIQLQTSVNCIKPGIISQVLKWNKLIISGA
jgi:hypothetical protein